MKLYVKKIIVKWVPTEHPDIHAKEMRVVSSGHERFVTGSRFDFGFLRIASGQGYVIEILP